MSIEIDPNTGEVVQAGKRAAVAAEAQSLISNSGLGETPEQVAARKETAERLAAKARQTASIEADIAYNEAEIELWTQKLADGVQTEEQVRPVIEEAEMNIRFARQRLAQATA